MNTAGLLQKVPRAIELARDVCRRRRRSIFAHYPFGVGRIPAAFVPDITRTADDVAMARRLLAAYRAASSENPVPRSQRPEDVWSHIEGRRQRTFFALLDSGDPEQLASYLCNMSRHDATHGTVQGDVEYRPCAQPAIPPVRGLHDKGQAAVARGSGWRPSVRKP